jgi:Mg2+-importing ATPase
MLQSQELLYWNLQEAELLKTLGSRPEGLQSSEAEKRLRTYGENVLQGHRRTTALRLFLSQFKNPIVIILILATFISAATGELLDAGIILLIVLASAILSFTQEYSAGNAVEELRSKVRSKANTYRDGALVELPAARLVPGDVVRLSAGSLVPADGRILESRDFYVNQSMLTGESMPVRKGPGVLPPETSLEERTNCLFMGTSVHSGTALLLVVETGEQSETGQIASKLSLRPPETEFEQGVRKFGYLLTQMMFILTLAVFAINVYFQRPAMEALLFSVALAVGITPQLLPAIISITLSKGSRIMAHKGVIVRKLEVIENFGSMDILCTDKTGTLTEGVIRLDGAADMDGTDSPEVFRLAFINASLQTGMDNSLDDAISQSPGGSLAGVEKIGEIPFDFERERLSVLVRDGGTARMVMKGALPSTLSVCTRVLSGGAPAPLDGEAMERIQARYKEWSSQGIRVLGVAVKDIVEGRDYSLADEKDMVFAGFLRLFDHPKSDAPEAIKALARNGVGLRIITGDNKLIGMHTAEAVGLEVQGVLTGRELMGLSDEALWNRVETTTIFAEVDPNQKERIILALKKKNHVVGYMGDGINDVPALHAADVSISVDNAVDVAKDSADFVLLKKSLAVLNRGIELGRATFGNTLKYIMVTTSANFGNMFSMAGASLFLPFLPLLPKQILMINFLSDFPAITIAYDRVDTEILRKPGRWNIRFIRNFMFTFGLISSVFDFLVFAILILGFQTGEDLFRSSWFVASILTELLILMIMRTRRPFFKSRPARVLLVSSILVGIAAVAMPYLPFAGLLGLAPLPPGLLASLLGVAAMYILVNEVAKHFFYRHFKP